MNTGVLFQKIPFSLYHIKDLESYLASQSLDGFVLVATDKKKCTFGFAKTNPQKNAYRVLLNHNQLENEEVEKIQENHWMIIDSIQIRNGFSKDWFYFLKREAGTEDENWITEFNKGFITKLNPYYTIVKILFLYSIPFFFLAYLVYAREVNSSVMAGFIGFGVFFVFEMVIPIRAQKELKNSLSSNTLAVADWKKTELEERTFRVNKTILMPIVMIGIAAIVVFLEKRVLLF